MCSEFDCSEYFGNTANAGNNQLQIVVFEQSVETVIKMNVSSVQMFHELFISSFREKKNLLRS